MAACLLGALAAGCAGVPKVSHGRYSFPQGEAQFGNSERPYEVLGLVRSKAEFATLDPDVEERVLCQNYFNKAVRDLVKIAKKRGADAVLDLRSVTFFPDGRVETYEAAECSDEGDEGQVLVQGVAVKWKVAQSKPPGKVPHDTGAGTTPVEEVSGFETH